MPNQFGDSSIKSTTSIASSSSTSSLTRKTATTTTTNFIERNKKIISRPKTANNNKPTRTTTQPQVAIKCLNDDEQVAEISVISSRSSIDTVPVQGPNSDRQREIERASESCERLRSMLAAENGNVRPSIDLSTTDSPKLVQGEEVEIENLDDFYTARTAAFQSRLSHDGGNIVRFESGKSEIRQQLMKKFGSTASANQPKRKEVIMPHIIDDRMDQQDSNVHQNMMSTATTGLGTWSSASASCASSNARLDGDQLASIAASTIATLNALNQPSLVRIQSDLEGKISAIIDKLEELKASEQTLAEMVIRERSRSRSRQNREGNVNGGSCSPTTSGEDSLYESNRTRAKRSRQRSEEDQARLKYIERLQESQFQLMGQLMGLIEQQQHQQRTIPPSNSAPSMRTAAYYPEPQVGVNQSAVARPLRKTRRKTKSKSKSRSTSNVAAQASRSRSQSGCSVCDNEKRRNRSRSRSQSRTPSRGGKKKADFFLEELLDTAKSPNHSALFGPATSKTLKPKSQPDTLFDKYLKEAKELNKKLSEEEAVIEAERKRQAEQDAAIQAKLNESETLAKNNKRKSSMFGDIKEVLKAVELTKKQIDMNAAQTMRERENKLANILSSVASGADQNERLRMKKLVDGCINAISTDVKRIVGQKLIDQSKHVKLEAERDRPGARAGVRPIRQTLPEPAKKPTTTVSEVRKYLNKVYGQDLLNRIKNEEIEERNRQAKEEAELRKKQLELEKQQKKQHESRKTKADSTNIANRPPFMTIQEPFQSYPENKIKSFEKLLKDAQTKFRVNANENVATVVILPHKDGSKSRSTSRDLKRQNLPSMSITSTGQSPKRVINTKVVDIKSDKTDPIDDTDIDRNQSGSGIHIKGDGLNYTEEFEKFKGSLESKTLDWLEREILSHFMRNQPVDQEDENDEVADPKLADLLDSIGRTLYVDLGQPVDPNLVEALCFEVLDEKISAMIFNKEHQQPIINDAPPPLKPQQPIPSPRRTLDYIESSNRPAEIEVRTPIATPSPPRSPSPLPGNRAPVESKFQQTETLIQLVKMDKDDDSESLLNVSVDEELELLLQENRANVDTGATNIVIPPTPVETPTASPSPPSTPEPSEEAPPPPPQKNYATTSVQCDPEPKPVIVVPPPPPPPPPQPESESESELTESESTYTTSEESSTTLTSEDKSKATSDSYMSDGAWLISKSEGQIIPIDETAYINLDMNAALRGLTLNPRASIDKQLGDQLNSQSEGEFGLNHVNPAMMIGKQLRPGVNRISRDMEKGEVGRGREPAANMTGLRTSEGEIWTGGVVGIGAALPQQQQPPRKMSSEGECENPVEKRRMALEAQLHELSTRSAEKKTKKKTKSKSPSSKNRRVVDLEPPAASKPSKNSIKIQPISKETPNNRGSDDFERRFYSSTPDTSMLISSTTSQQQKAEPKQPTTTNPQQQYRDLLRELEKHEDYREEIEEDEGEVVELSIDLPEDDDDDDEEAKKSPKTSQNNIDQDSEYE